MGTSTATVTLAAVNVRRARRSDLGAVFALIQRAWGGQLSQQDLIQKATGYGYLIAEAQERIIGVAGLLVENSVACVRDLTAASTAMRGLATVALMNAIENDAGALACEAVLVQVPPDSSLIQALLADRHYEPKKLDELSRLSREVAREQFEPQVPLWVNNLRERGR